MPDVSSPYLFPVTRWTLLQRLHEGTADEARAALETLCRAYWQPLYFVARQKQMDVHDAQDAVQGFFERVLRREIFADADPKAGKLRQLLLCAFDHFCTQQWEKRLRLKRGGDVVHLTLDEMIDSESAEKKYLLSDSRAVSMETLYNREWAQSVLARSLHALRSDYERRGWQERYELLIGTLLQGENTAPLETLADARGVTPGSLRVSLHRMRTHYRHHIEQELAATLDTDDPRLIREELTDLFNAFAAP